MRLLFGALYLFNGALPWTHLVVLPVSNAKAAAILIALSDTGIVMQVVKSLEVVAGLLLILNRFVPLALVVLMPITIFIAIVDLDLDPNPLAIGGGGFLLLANTVLMCIYLDYYRPLLAYKTKT